ncbi:PLAC8 family protein [Hirsutella rhossiliensis]|uniref:PLAC8 family domain-containing protein n=1 Tax=Hirsutella rhossiliensis TaxID=111463 RepID=A0A9P8MNF6_9HYPO|nr:PLAC8 family domain-containing protein [Hirsutella rhossiliensis]KAH0958224.1 PLAC8 family domain-containing protein [Hirsutella rhossiliensis]
MEKQTAEERKRQWQWQAANGARDTFNKSCLEATCWPCGAYSRTSSRLRSALSGQDAERIPDQGFCNPECTQFAICLPFYGCFLARLQTTVRSFYAIDGGDVSDWYDGCCCPCLTLVRDEQEILLREKQHSRLKELHDPGSSVRSQYQPQAPMSWGGSGYRSSPLSGRQDQGLKGRKVAAPGTKDKAEPPASQTGRVVPLVQSSAASLQSRVDEASPQKPVPIAAALVGRHSLTHDQLVALSLPDMAHDLRPLPLTQKEPKPGKHVLERDALAPTGTSGLAVHHLDSDPAAAQQPPASQHKLTDDQAVKADTASHSHALKNDAAFATKEAGREHPLETDPAVSTPGREDPHVLEDDATTAAASSGSAGHGLDHDVKEDLASPDTKHGLRSDKEVKTKLPLRKPQASGGQ